eukprot:sb/3468913/
MFIIKSDPDLPGYSREWVFPVNRGSGKLGKKTLLEGLYAMGFNKPSKIQETALPMLMCEPPQQEHEVCPSATPPTQNTTGPVGNFTKPKPQNMIAQSQSGTGKTAAFTLATLHRIDESQLYPQALILAPTYELALQIGEVLEKMANRTSIKIEHAVRGKRHARGSQIAAHVIIGTPGTTVDWIFKLKFIDPSRLKVFVLDEADVMVSQQGHQEQSIRIKNDEVRPDSYTRPHHDTTKERGTVSG